MKALVRRLLGRRGYEIRKAPRTKISRVSVFDLAIAHLMAVRGPSISFIQIGANDGVFGDPVRDYVLRYPWRGLLVEPQPDVFDRLRRNYEPVAGRLIFENCAVSREEGTVKMYRATSGEGESATAYESSVASVDRGVASAQLRRRGSELEELEVPALRLDTLVNRHKLNGFEVLQVDTEGHEVSVLESLDFATERPLVVQFEHGHLSPDEIDTIVKRLAANDYLLHFGGWESDSLAIRADFAARADRNGLA